MWYDKAQTFMIDKAPPFSHMIVGSYFDPTDHNSIQSIKLDIFQIFLNVVEPNNIWTINSISFIR